jgi:hypothetical protein
MFEVTPSKKNGGRMKKSDRPKSGVDIPASQIVNEHKFYHQDTTATIQA